MIEAIILAQRTASIELLGESYQKAKRDLSDSWSDPTRLENECRAVNFGYRIPNDIPATLEQLCSEHLSPILLARRCRDLFSHARSDVQTLIPFVGGDVAYAVPNDQVRLADVHLHSGASLDFGRFLSLAVDCPEIDIARWQRDDLLVRDIYGVRFRLWPLVAGLRVALHYLRVKAWPGTFDGANPAPELLWADVYSQAARAEGSTLEGLAFADLYGSAIDNPPEDAFSFMCRAIDNHTEDDLADSELLWGALKTCTMLYQVVTARPGEGLTRFVSRFNTMASVRKSLLRAERSSLVQKACEVVLSDGVEMAEFRKTATFLPTERFSGIEADLEDHLSGFARFTGSIDRPVALTMPVGFLRAPSAIAPPVVESSVRCRYPFSGHMALAQDLHQLRRSSDVAARIITAVDVAGDENGSCNWPFLVTMEYLRRCDGENGVSQLKYLLHAGESFSWRLQGLRRVGELLVVPGLVSRVGHAIALDGQVSRRIAPGTVPPMVKTLEAMEDLAWCARGDSAIRPEAQSLLSSILEFVDSTVPVSDMVSGWWQRFSLDSIIGLGLASCSPDLLPRDDCARDALDIDEYRYRAGSNPGLTFWYFECEQMICDRWSDHLSTELRRRFADFCQRWTDTVEQTVVAALRQASVVVEGCPSSNQVLSGESDLSDMHYGRLMEKDLKVCLGSDDPLIFGSSVANEYRRIVRAFGPGIASLMAQSSVDQCTGSVLHHDQYVRYLTAMIR